MLAKKQTNPISPSDDENWSMFIETQRHWFDLRLGELWRYKIW